MNTSEHSSKASTTDAKVFNRDSIPQLDTYEHRVLICGDREWKDENTIRELVHRIPGRSLVITGGARGADRIAARAAHDAGIDVLWMPAEWDRYGKAAGYRRNDEMLRKGCPTFVIAFHENIKQSKGTKMMLELAKNAGVPTKLVTSKVRPTSEEKGGN